VFQFEALFGQRADLLADGKGGRGAWGRGVEDMNGAVAFSDDEVVDQRAVGGDRLGAHSGAAGHEVAFADFRQ